jgi:benzodiazapine receptor
MIEKQTALQVATAVLLPNAGGCIMGYLTRKEIDGWYEKLKHPSFRPPNAVFAPVWTSLYTSMGYASYLVWRDGGGFAGDAKLPLGLYAAHLALNFAWTPIFFTKHELKWVIELFFSVKSFSFLNLLMVVAFQSFVEICALTTSVFFTGVAFSKVNKVAGIIFIPYFLWCSFATLLNYSIYKNNPEPVTSATIEEVKEE